MNSIIYPDALVAFNGQYSGKVTCFIPIDNQLLVGLNNGSLLIYEAGGSSNEQNGSDGQNVSPGKGIGEADEDPLNSPVTLTSLSRHHSNVNSRNSSIPPSPVLGPSRRQDDNHGVVASTCNSRKWFNSAGLPKLKLIKEVQLGRPIVCMRYIKDVGYLFIQQDNVINIYNYSTFKFKQTIDTSKGVSVFRIFSQLEDSELINLYDEPKKESHGSGSKQQNSVESRQHGSVDSDLEDIQSKLQKIDSYSLYRNFYDHDPFDQESSSSFDHSSLSIQEENSNMIHSHLVFAVKRKLYILSWVLDDPESGTEKEVILPDRVKNFEFMSGSRIVVGLNTDFVIVDLYSLQITPLIIPSTKHSSFIGSPFSSIGLGGYKHIINLVKVSKLNTLVSRDQISVKINSRGELLNKSTLNWTIIPDHILFLFPYLILVNSSHLEVRDLKNGYLLQSIAVSNVSQVSVNNFKNEVYIYNNDKILKCNMKSYIYQLNKLEQENKLNEAINLTFQLPASLLPDKVSRLRQLQIKKAETLFKQNKFQESMTLFSSFLAPPALVLSLFPKFITGNIAHNHAEEYSSLAKLKYSDLVASTPPKSPPSTPNRYIHQPKPTTPKKFEDTDSLYSFSSKATGTPNRYQRYHQPGNAQVQNRKTLLRALQSLLPYLADTRRKISKMFAFEEKKQDQTTDDSLSDDVSNLYWKSLVIPKDIFGDLKEAAELVDTTLFNCYLVSSPGLIGPLVRINNFCNVKIVEKNLIKRQLFKELVDFYYGKGLHEKALQLLLKLGKGEEVTKEFFEEPNTSSSDDDESLDGISTVMFNTPNTTSLKGPLHTVQYLTKLSQDNIDLIFKYIKWPMKLEPEKSMIVFLADSSEAESLNKDQIVNFLLENFKDNRTYTIVYLEHIIDGLQDKTPRLHTQYVNLLLKSSVEEDKLATKDIAIKSYDKLVAFLSSTNIYEPRKTLRILLDYQDFAPKYLYLKTFIYKRLEDHRKVLNILVYDLQYHDKASQYCSVLFSQNNLLGTQYLHELLKMYLLPPPPSSPSSTSQNTFKPNLEAALALLSAQGSRMSAVEVLKTLPADIPVAKICSIFPTQFKLLQSRLSHSRVQSSLSKVRLVKCQEELLGLKSKSITVTENRICCHCKKKLGHSVLSVFPNGQVTHYGCARAYQNDINRAKGENQLGTKKVIAFGDR